MGGMFIKLTYWGYSPCVAISLDPPLVGSECKNNGACCASAMTQINWRPLPLPNEPTMLTATS